MAQYWYQNSPLSAILRFRISQIVIAFEAEIDFATRVMTGCGALAPVPVDPVVVVIVVVDMGVLLVEVDEVAFDSPRNPVAEALAFNPPDGPDPDTVRVRRSVCAA